MRKATLLAVAALLVLGGVGAAALFASSGGDDSSPPPGLSSAGEPEQRTETAPPAPEPAAPADSPERDTTLGETAPAPQPSEGRQTRKTRFPRERGKSQKNDAPQRKFSVPPAREFSGTGNATLGSVDLRQPAVVKWTTKGRFELRFGREDFPIVAPSASGQLIVPPYSFERVRVIAKGRWKITITPQS